MANMNPCRNMTDEEFEQYFRPKSEIILKNALPFVQHYMTQDHFSFNILSTLNNAHDETHVHSKIIYKLLCNNGTDREKSLLLKLFLKHIKVNEPEINERWTVSREKYFNKGRIDFVLESKSRCIAVEMKIHAGDQPKQLERYDAYCKSKKKPYTLYYLTLHGTEPSSESLGELDQTSVKRISFREHICNWLLDCMKHIEPNEYKYSFIKQYYGAIQDILNIRDIGDDQLKELIQSSEDAYSALFAIAALQERITDTMSRLLQGVQQRIQRATNIDTLFDADRCKDYYESKKPLLPRTISTVKKTRINGCHYAFCVVTEITHNYYFAMGFMQEKDGEWDWICLSDMKSKSESFYASCMETSAEFDDLDIKKEGDMYYWQFLDNTCGEKLNFHDFSDSVLALIDRLNDEIIHIGDFLINSIFERII